MESMVSIARNSAERILGGAAFLFLEDVSPEETPDMAVWTALGMKLSYEGPVRGELRLWLEEGLAHTLAVNMLGLEDGETIPLARELDAAKEILNMVVGNFITEAFGSEDVYHLGIPEVLDRSEIEESLATPKHFWVDIEGKPALFSLHQEKEFP
ncbi:MAG TPA: chemotaxis protein CheX [Fibrobacteraceae bacterium]|nr:chemotaxis protein CheX [Fibrobacteraceae bacterium]